MRVLALDTTTRGGSVAMLDGDRVLAERAGEPGRSHAERLPLAIMELLAETRLSSADVELFAVACGPGSFTGLRIGIATIQGFAFVHGTRVAPISALRALGEVAAAGARAGTRVGAWMDAHRGEVFSALYEVDGAAGQGSGLVELEAAAVGTAAKTLARWATRGWMPMVIAGDGADMYADLLAPAIQFLPSPLLASTIARLGVAAAAAGDTVPPDAVLPLYVRRPDAEVARDAARAAR